MEDIVERANEGPLSILVIANQDSNSDWIRTSLKEWDYKLIGIFDSVNQALQIVQETQVDIILADSSAHGVLEIECAVAQQRTHAPLPRRAILLPRPSGGYQPINPSPGIACGASCPPKPAAWRRMPAHPRGRLP